MSSQKGGKKDSDSRGGKKPSKKTSLPAFGFAADLLKNRGASQKGTAAPQGTTATPGPADQVAGSDRVSAAAQREVPSPTDPLADAADPNRIFSFADSLETSYEEEEAARIRYETWVTLTLAGETFALPVEPVREILRISAITRVPHSPYPIRGVTNLRGKVIPVIDLRIRLELPQGDLTRASRIVVVGSRGRLLGLLVDGVHQVVHLNVEHIQPPPQDVMTVQSDYISGVYHMEKELILLLNVDRALVIRDAAGPPGRAETAGTIAQGAGAV